MPSTTHEKKQLRNNLQTVLKGYFESICYFANIVIALPNPVCAFAQVLKDVLTLKWLLKQNDGKRKKKN